MAESLNNQMKALTLEQLHTLKFKVEQEILERSQQNRTCVIKQVKMLCKEYDISATELRGAFKASPTTKKKRKKSPPQCPIKQALTVIAQGREYITQKGEELTQTHCKNQHYRYVDWYALDVVDDVDREKTSAFNVLRAKLAAVTPKPILVTQLDTVQQRRVARLSAMISSTMETSKLTTRALQAVLTAQEYDDYLSHCNEPSHNDVYTENVPAFFDDYIAFVKQADLYNASADKLAKARHRTYQKGRSSAEIVRNKAEGFYEKAIECLEGLYDTSDWALAQQWLDRDVVFGEHGKEPNPCVVEIPRLRNSKSSHVRMGLPKKDKYLKNRLAAIKTLCGAIETIVYEPDAVIDESHTDNAPSATASLRELLAKFDNDLDF